MLRATFWGGLLVLLVSPLATPVDFPRSSLFDKPLREVHIPLPPDPDNPQFKPNLACYYYPHLMVKQVDVGEKGATDLTITSIDGDQRQPLCHREKGKDEREANLWCGYFSGVKGDFIFFRACDGTNGGLGFTVLNPAAERIFDDIGGEVQSIELIVPNVDANKGPFYNSPLQLRYQRVFAAPCSLQMNKKDCWQVIKQVTGLTDQDPPACNASYNNLKKRASPAEWGTVPLDPSVIRYEVEVVLDLGTGVIRAAPTSKAEKCDPAD